MPRSLPTPSTSLPPSITEPASAASSPHPDVLLKILEALVAAGGLVRELDPVTGMTVYRSPVTSPLILIFEGPIFFKLPP
jgi:hypothetical protein